jgi:prophage antirepressor-like protein
MELSTHCFQDHDVSIAMCGGVPWFKACDVANALDYSNTKQAVLAHVSEQYKRTLTQLRLEASGNKVCASDHIPASTVGRPATFISESGVYELIIHSHKPEALKFRAWLFEEVLPEIVRTGRYGGQMRDEADLHVKVVRFLRKAYPEAIIVAGLGENQDTSEKRLMSYRKGYTRGQSDLIILNRTRRHSGLAIELKRPDGRGAVNESQTEFLRRLAQQHFDTLLSCCYDDVVLKIIEHRNAARRCRNHSIPALPWLSSPSGQESTTAGAAQI